ncbi:hypothetical protein E2C01_096688 [Portunus trituberculatus]|uniref:Uncharacterized protein n=1 Tax=Portunus trituberculatus TaxID=210409 RepID=A0A5B7K2E4_PORTR|nr:hypothetical protein [Portunus trituberculatus]
MLCSELTTLLTTLNGWLGGVTGGVTGGEWWKVNTGTDAGHSAEGQVQTGVAGRSVTPGECTCDRFA